MTKNAITWIREDFRIEHNPALAYATQNHENVLALYIYNKADFDNKEKLKNGGSPDLQMYLNWNYQNTKLIFRYQREMNQKFFRKLKKKIMFQFTGIKFMNLTLSPKEKKLEIFL